MEPTSRIEIDLSKLDENLRAWREALEPGCEVCPVVKADGYGLGAVPIARRLAGAGVKRFAVYSLPQAADLAGAGLPGDILVLMPVEALDRTDVVYRMAVSGRLHLAVHSAEQLDRIEAIGNTFGSPMAVHIEVDTGMGRLGMSVEEADAILEGIGARRYIRLAGVFSHCAAAATDKRFTAQQCAKFESLLERHASLLNGACIHFAGTCASYRDKRFHKSMVRLGLGLYGYGDLGDDGLGTIDSPPRVTPIARWMSRIVHVRELPPETSVGYQRTFITKRKTRLGVVPVGHSDGYPVALANKGVVRVGEKLQRAPIRGMVNMDQISVDLTSLPKSIGVGTEVEVYSDDPEAPNAVPKIAKLTGTNPYEILCRLSPRVQRKYIVRNRETGRVGHVATV